MSAMDFLRQIQLGSYQSALPVPGILRLCNHLQNAGATTYILGLQLSTFIFYNKQFNGLITVNEIGAFLWNHLQEDVTVDELVNYVLDEYEVDEETAREDILEFLDILANGGILEKS